MEMAASATIPKFLITKIENATFERIEPIVLGFVPLSLPIRTHLRTIGLICSIMAFSVFHFSVDSISRKTQNGLRFARPAEADWRLEAKTWSEE